MKTGRYVPRFSETNSTEKPKMLDSREYFKKKLADVCQTGFGLARVVRSMQWQ